MRRAPEFWANPPEHPGWQARALAPAAWLWRLGAWARARRGRPRRAGVPVICVGNLTAGGAGKTPMVHALAARLSAAGHRPHLLSRGYRGRIPGPHRVDPNRDSAAEVGDEALLLAADAPTWVARDRVGGARAAEAAGASVVVMDDGYQDPALVKDASILVVDAVQGFGNGRMIPAGPLRESVVAGLARADLTVLIGSRCQRSRALERWPALDRVSPLGAEIVPVRTGLELSGAPVLAFAGLGRPEKFFTTLEAMGARLIGAEPFPDHHRYPQPVLRRLLTRARESGAMLVTTEKDAVRLPHAFRREVVVVQVMLEPVNWSGIDALIARIGAK